jgi:transcriptional regulator GlxA family with amidase domain
MTKVAVVEVEGRMASSAAITHDVMATANRISSARRTLPFKVTTVRCGSRRSWGELRGADLVIVPGLGSPSGEELERNLKGHACRRARDMVANAFASGAMLAASCASTFLLAEGGLLDGRRATTTWWFAPLFRQRYPKVELVTEQIVVADWPIATAGAAMAQMDLMLAIVDRFAGRNLAKACANHLLLDERHSQVPFMAISYLSSQDPWGDQSREMGAR